MANFIKISAVLVMSASMSGAALSVADAGDAEWGCQILLCAASENPSWHGVPYCVPPMRKLIHEMSKPRFKWPICPGAGTGGPGFEKYKDCPAGYEPSRPVDDMDRPISNELSECRNIAHSKGVYRFNGRKLAEPTLMPRGLRAKPHFFDIPQKNGQKQRFWFDLNLD